mmetsp:Transcript_31711/g.63329  ORF Transcript_31711/g.63329 Transcript_31711/m.63329 type:complete len:329 (-) Transcript_31711:40-1026(-)
MCKDSDSVMTSSSATRSRYEAPQSLLAGALNAPFASSSQSILSMPSCSSDQNHFDASDGAIGASATTTAFAAFAAGLPSACSPSAADSALGAASSACSPPLIGRSALGSASDAGSGSGFEPGSGSARKLAGGGRRFFFLRKAEGAAASELVFSGTIPAGSGTIAVAAPNAAPSVAAWATFDRAAASNDWHCCHRRTAVVSGGGSGGSSFESLPSNPAALKCTHAPPASSATAPFAAKDGGKRPWASKHRVASAGLESKRRAQRCPTGNASRAMYAALACVRAAARRAGRRRRRHAVASNGPEERARPSPTVSSREKLPAALRACRISG